MEGNKQTMQAEACEQRDKAVTDAEIAKAHEFFMKMIQTPPEEINRSFNSGMFNSIAIGYAKLALKMLEYKPQSCADFERAMERAFDNYDAADARKAYQTLDW